MTDPFKLNLPKGPTITLDFNLDASEIFPIRVVAGSQVYEFNARVIEHTTTKRINRFTIEVVGEITIAPKPKKKRGSR